MIVYRDGLGTSMIPSIKQTEIDQMLGAVSELEAETKIVYIVVNKKINQRFFKEGRNGLCNPEPGTVVNQGVVEPNSYDFYLISQITKQGVSSPTHYRIVHDDTGLDPAKLELLTFKLCFNYYNVSGSIKVPSPVQYANRLACLIGDRGRDKDGNFPIPHNVWSTNLNYLYFI